MISEMMTNDKAVIREKLGVKEKLPPGNFYLKKGKLEEIASTEDLEVGQVWLYRGIAVAGNDFYMFQSGPYGRKNQYGKEAGVARYHDHKRFFDLTIPELKDPPVSTFQIMEPVIAGRASGTRGFLEYLGDSGITWGVIDRNRIYSERSMALKDAERTVWNELLLQDGSHDSRRDAEISLVGVMERIICALEKE